MGKTLILIFGIAFLIQVSMSSAEVKLKDPRIAKFFELNKNYSLKTVFSKSVRMIFEKDDSPAYLKGDFDGDGNKEDHILLVQDNKNEYICLLLSSNEKPDGGCRRIQKSDDRYLSFIPKEDVIFDDNKITPRDIYQLEYYLGDTQAFYVDGGKEKIFKGEITQD